MPTKKRKITFIASDELASTLEEFSRATGSTLSSAVNQLLIPSIPVMKEMIVAFKEIRAGNPNPTIAFLAELKELCNEADIEIGDLKKEVKGLKGVTHD